jgi:hypothetical protein
VDQAQLQYFDILGNNYIQTFNVLFVRGMDLPYKWNFIPPEAYYKFPDGSARTNYVGFQRIIAVELTALDSNEAFIEAFLQSVTRILTYQGINFVPEDCVVVYESSAFNDEWFDDFKHTKKYVFELIESSIHQVWPVPTPIVITDIMYIAKKVKIEGTQATPELFTTNSGKLQYNYGTTPFPNISVTGYNVTIMCNAAPYQDAKVNQVGDITQSGLNIAFYLAVSDTGNPSSDGFFYADLTIGLQAIV